MTVITGEIIMTQPKSMIELAAQHLYVD